MNGQITTYSPDFISFSYDVEIISPTSPALFNTQPLKEITVNIPISNNLNRYLEFSYAIYQSHFYSFKYPLKCKLTYKKSLISLTNDLLYISVWGSTQEEVVDAFYFQFYSLYCNFAIENDENLSEEAIILKSKILDLISLVL